MADVKDHDVVPLDSIEDRVMISADVRSANPTFFSFLCGVRMIEQPGKRSVDAVRKINDNGRSMLDEVRDAGISSRAAGSV